MAVKKLKFTIVSQFENAEDFGGDELGVYVELDSEKLATFGDYYHDKGRDRAEGYCRGYADALNVFYDVGYIERADWVD